MADSTSERQDLRERAIEVLNTTLVAPDGGIERSTEKWDRHDRHNFLYNCAVCQGNVPAVVAAVLATVSPVLDRLRARVTELEATPVDWDAQRRRADELQAAVDRAQAEAQRLLDNSTSGITNAAARRFLAALDPSQETTDGE